MPGESIRLFLVSGKPDALLPAELINWTGYLLVGGIDDLPAIVSRQEAARPGLYFLLGNNGDPALPSLYIGESENVGDRLIQHERSDSKAFAERVCVVTSKDANLTKSHIRYLESKLVQAAESVGRAKLANGNIPSLPSLPEADQADMDNFLRKLAILMPLVGFDFFWALQNAPGAEAQNVTTNSVDLTLSFGGTSMQVAKARYQDGRLIVLSGSKAKPDEPSSTNLYRGQREGHKAYERLIKQPDGSYVFAVDVEFSSPSAAAAVILDRNANGRAEWRVTGTTKTLKDYQDEQLPKLPWGL